MFRLTESSSGQSLNHVYGTSSEMHIFGIPKSLNCMRAVGIIIIITFTLKHRLSQEECARLLEGVPYVKVYRYNPKHLYPKLNGYRDNGQRKVWSSGGSTHCTCQLTVLSMSVLECGVI
jgi:hypothetical protein